jgi:hypothetical protein
MSEISENQEEIEERFCSRCGRSLVPLTDTIHVSRPCERCGKTIYLVEPGEEGKGIKVREGDNVTIPAGFIKLSLDPKVGGTFFRMGLLGFIDMLLTSGRPKSADELEELFEHHEKEGLGVLRGSPLLKGLDVNNEKDADEIWQRLSEHKESRELAAALTVSFIGNTRNALAENDARRAAWAIYNAGIYHSVFITKEEHFQEILWEGYRAHKFLSQVDDAAAQTPAEVKALENLKPLFEKQGEATLHTWVEDGRPIGPRINVPEIPEETLRATAKYYLSQFERNRKLKEAKQEERRKNIELFIKFMGAFVGLGLGIITALKAFGII